ncbi:MAG: hypothetical protein HND47_06865 [Chloroflexi bacterium]|nr:hypothetical protein [Chloroflexota bacterium]
MSKKFLFVAILCLIAAAVFTGGSVSAASSCTTLKDEVITYSPGHYLYGDPILPGYDAFGYNYQAYLFKGSYANIYLGRDGLPPYAGDDAAYLDANPSAEWKWYWPYRTTRVLMKWNDAWLSNKDCDGNGTLDRHYGYPSYIGSGAWETNHMLDSYLDGDLTCNWVYFTKIIAAPADATASGGTWYAADGTEIGPSIWGEFATIQSVYNDPCAGFTGIEYLSPDHAGFGGW